MTELSPIALPGRTRLLVSVRDAAEAAMARAAGADLIDAKDPDNGALGALPVPVVAEIVTRLGGSVETSAVAGEPEHAEALVASVSAMAATGVGYVKVSLRPDFGASDLRAAAAAAHGRLIAVLFAEDGFDPGIVPRLAAAGLCGAMIDTRGKQGRRLRDWLDAETLAAFVGACRAQRLLSGLAGSLRVEDVPRLAAHRPGYLGFRGGLCRGGDRRHPLDPERVSEVVRALRALTRRDAA